MVDDPKKMKDEEYVNGITKAIGIPFGRYTELLKDFRKLIEVWKKQDPQIEGFGILIRYFAHLAPDDIMRIFHFTTEYQKWTEARIRAEYASKKDSGDL